MSSSKANIPNVGDLPYKVKQSLNAAQKKQIDSVQEIRPDFSEAEAYHFCSKHKFIASDVNEALAELIEDAAKDSSDDWHEVADKKTKKQPASDANYGRELPVGASSRAPRSYPPSSSSSSSSSSSGSSSSSSASYSSSNSSAPAQQRPVGSRGNLSNTSSVPHMVISITGKESSTPDLSSAYAAAAAAGGHADDWEQKHQEHQKPIKPLAGAWGKKSFVELVSSSKPAPSPQEFVSKVSAASVAAPQESKIVVEDVPLVVAPVRQLPSNSRWSAGNPLTNKKRSDDSVSNSSAHPEPAPAVSYSESIPEHATEYVQEEPEQIEAAPQEFVDELQQEPVQHIEEPEPEIQTAVEQSVSDATSAPASDASASVPAITPELLQQLLSQYGLSVEMKMGQLSVSQVAAAAQASANTASEAVQTTAPAPQTAAPAVAAPQQQNLLEANKVVAAATTASNTAASAYQQPQQQGFQQQQQQPYMPTSFPQQPFDQSFNLYNRFGAAYGANTAPFQMDVNNPYAGAAAAGWDMTNMYQGNKGSGKGNSGSSFGGRGAAPQQAPAAPASNAASNSSLMRGGAVNQASAQTAATPAVPAVSALKPEGNLGLQQQQQQQQQFQYGNPYAAYNSYGFGGFAPPVAAAAGNRGTQGFGASAAGLWGANNYNYAAAANGAYYGWPAQAAQGSFYNPYVSYGDASQQQPVAPAAVAQEDVSAASADKGADKAANNAYSGWNNQYYNSGY